MRHVLLSLAVLTATCAHTIPRARPAQATAFKPSVVRFGATLDETKAALGPGGCAKMTVRRIERPFIVLRDIVKNRQDQLDCDGFVFLGKPRWAEFVFADDTLQMIWIMTTADERVAIESRMTSAYGAPTHTNEKFIAFARDRAALRTDVAEVLFYGNGPAKAIDGWFAPVSTFR